MRLDLAAVRQALDNDELEPYFQPVVELSTGLLKGFEVLARWNHPRLGLTLPENFISLAERDGFIGRLSFFLVCPCTAGSGVQRIASSVARAVRPQLDS